MSETEFVPRLSASGNGDCSGLCAIVIASLRANGVGRHLILVRGQGQVDRLFKPTGYLRPEEHLQRVAPADVWARGR
jgi:hypothetical protein